MITRRPTPETLWRLAATATLAALAILVVVRNRDGWLRLDELLVPIFGLFASFEGIMEMLRGRLIPAYCWGSLAMLLGVLTILFVPFL